MLPVQVKVKRREIGVFSWHHFASAHCDRFDRPPKALELTAAVYWSLPMVQVWFFSSPMTVVLFTSSAAHTAVCMFQQWAVRSWKWQILRRGSAVQTPTTSWQNSAKGANWSSGCWTISPGGATQPETFPAETWPHQTPSSASDPPDLLPQAPRSTTAAPPQAAFKPRTSTRHKEELCDLDKASS